MTFHFNYSLIKVTCSCKYHTLPNFITVLISQNYFLCPLSIPLPSIFSNYTHLSLLNISRKSKHNILPRQ